MRRFVMLSSLALGCLSCMDQATPTEPNAVRPALTIADAAYQLTPGFYWLPPLGLQPPQSATFDAGLAPEVEICELAGSACRQVLATYTMTFGPGGETVRLDRGAHHYAVNWSTRDFHLRAESRYRITVRAGRGVQLGYADVVAVANGSAHRNDIASDAVVVIGRTVPIKFRIETGIVGDVAVTPPRVSLGPGATQQFVATLRDLHGNPVSALVTWASSNSQVATVTSSGLATAIAAGEATITAMAGQVTGSASLTVTAASIAQAVSAGFDHSCALTAAGRVYCWGLGTLGQLGTGLSPEQQPTPALVVGGIAFASVDAGDFHTCGLTATGRAYCWGDGASGRLGDGTRSFRLVPTPVAGDLTFKNISAGASHTCGVTTAGVGYCWGYGLYGRLGNGSTTDQLTPSAVSGGLTFVSISAGYFHSCGITSAGRAYCWGDNEFGQLGIGWAAPNSPETIPIAVKTNLIFAAITVSAYQTCALTTSGRGYCWGSGIDGRLGTGSTADQSTPTPVASDLTFTSITTGYEHGCALAAVTGQAYCWGDATYGQIGTGSTARQLVPTPVAGGLTFTGLSAGYLHTCGVTAGAGQLYCWGSGDSGRLGTGTVSNELAPTPVASLP